MEELVRLRWREELERIEDLHYYENTYFGDFDFMLLDSHTEDELLANRVHDSRPEVAELAKEIYREYFPYVERNAMKKQLVISELDFEIHTEVFQEYGNWETVNQKFHIMRKERQITFQD